jgi:hypothetical protein
MRSGAQRLVSTHVGNLDTSVGMGADAAGESARATIWSTKPYLEKWNTTTVSLATGAPFRRAGSNCHNLTA